MNENKIKTVRVIKKCNDFDEPSDIENNAESILMSQLKHNRFKYLETFNYIVKAIIKNVRFLNNEEIMKKIIIEDVKDAISIDIKNLKYTVNEYNKFRIRLNLDTCKTPESSKILRLQATLREFKKFKDWSDLWEYVDEYLTEIVDIKEAKIRIRAKRKNLLFEFD